MRKIGGVTLAVSVLLVGCNGDIDGRAAWHDVLENCTVTDLNSDEVLYFGPSNSVGPGSIWRKANDNSYRLRWTLVELPDHDQFLQPGKDFTCSGTKSTGAALAASLGFQADPVPIEAELAGDLKKARSVELKPSAVAWDLVKEGPYELYIRQLPPDSGPRADLEKGTRLVLYRALRVGGYSATITFESSSAAGLKAKYSGPLPASITGSANLGLTAKWDDSGTMTLTSPTNFYIAGEIVPYDPTGFSSSDGGLGTKALAIEKSAKVVSEVPTPR